MSERDDEQVWAAQLREMPLEAILRELWARGFVIVPWNGEIEFVPEDKGEAMTA